MPLLQADAELLSNNELVAGVIEEIIDREELFALLPFMKIVGKAYVYNREDTISEADFLNPNDTVNEGAATFVDVTARLKILIGDVDVDKFLDETDNDTNDQKAIQIAAKAKGLARKFKRTLATGDSSVTPASFDGIQKFVTPAMSIVAGANGVDGGPLSLGIMDQLKDLVLLGADCFMMRSGTARALKALWRAAGGNHGDMFQLENFGRPVMAHDGVPIILNDFLPTNETCGATTNTCSIYAIRLNEVDGFHGIYGGKSAGIVVEDIGTVQNKDASRTRLKWYVATALKSTRSLARLAGVTNI